MPFSSRILFLASTAPLGKALAAGERWITVRPNGPGTQGHPLLIKPAGDGSMKVIGGAGGSLNHLRLTGVKSEDAYKEEARQRSKSHKEARKRQVEGDKALGLHGTKTVAREAVKEQLRNHERAFVKTVGEALGWKPEAMRFPSEAFANATPEAQDQAAKEHGRKLFEHARAAVDHQRQRLVQDAELRAEAGLGEVPLTAAAPEDLTVQDLSPVDDATKGLGFAPEYDKRAEAAGLTPEERQEEAATFKPAPVKPPAEGEPTPEERRRAKGEAITKELEAIREPGPKVDRHAVVDAKKAVELLRAEKALKAARKSAAGHNKAIDAAKEQVEPAAYPVEVGGAAPDSAITAELEGDLRTLKTRAFLDEVGKVSGGEALGRHIGVGAYNSINALALAAGGAALMDRSAVDVLGIAGSAQVLARRLASDLTPEELQHTQEAMASFHLDHYMPASDKALREARSWHEMAQEIELGEAASGADLAVAQELNAKRREFTAAAERTLGTALGEMEANAALVLALKQPKKEQVQVSLGKVSIESAITRLRALGLERGEYSLEKVGVSTMLVVGGAGMDRLAQPIAREDLARVRDSLDIIEGRRDEADWLPDGVARRPEGAMNVVPGTAARLAQPYQAGSGPDGTRRAVEDYIGGRAADGDSPAEIVASLLSEETLKASGDRRGFMAAVDSLAPLYDGEGKIVRAEAHTATFERLADAFTQRRYGGKLAPIHKQVFPVDQTAVNSLHAALAKHPEGVAAFKPIADLTPQDQGSLRAAFGEEFGRSDPAAEAMRAELDKLAASEPAREVSDMFGTGPNPLHTDWRANRDGLAEKLNAASMTWGKYCEVLGSPANAYRAMQDVVRSKVLREFADGQNRASPDAALKVGRTVIAHDLNHLDALDPVAREKRLAAHRALADSLRNRVAGQYSAGSVSDKLDAERAHEEAFGQSQMGLFGASSPPDAADDAAPEPAKPPALGERYTIGHQAERQVAGMMPIVGSNFRPGTKPPAMWAPSMSGKYVARQRAVKLIAQNRKVELGMGVGSGKTAIALSAFTHLHAAGKAKRALFAVPSIVQGQFHGEALTLLEAGKFKWHCDPGASRADRIAAYKDPDTHFSVVTHQALRDDLLHLAAKQDGSTSDAVVAKLGAMKPAERQAFMRGVMDAEGMSHDFLGVDEGHSLLNRAGKEDSRMATVLDAVGHGMSTHVSMTADPVKNDATEAFDVLAKMDPVRYSDRAAFVRRYGVDTAASKEGLRREMARHFYTGSIDPGVKAEKTEVKVDLHPAQHAQLRTIDAAASKARLARMKGEVDLPALKTLSPGSFAGVEEAKHAEVAKNLNRSIGILANTAVHHAISGSSKTDALAKIAGARKGRPGVVFCHHLDRVREIEARLKADGHRVVTLTGGDSSKEKDRKKAEFQGGQHDVMVMSDAGAVGANLQRGKWLAQYDTPMTAMVHAQRNGRIHRMGQTEDVELLDLVADHQAERRARKRLAEKYELRGIMTSSLDGLDDTGVAGYLNRARTGQQEAALPLHPAAPGELPPIVEDEQRSMF